MSRPTLKLATKPVKPRIPYSRLRRAVELFRNGYGPREQRKANSRKWLIAIESLGPKWVYSESLRVSRKEA